MGKISDTVVIGTNGNISLYTHHGGLNRFLLPFGEPSKEMSAAVSFLTPQQWGLYKVCGYYLLPDIGDISHCGCTGSAIMQDFP